MWDKLRLSARGNFSLRKIAFILLAGLSSALLLTIVQSTPSYADTATWNGDSINYGGDTYTKAPDTTALPGIGSDREAYITEPKDGIVKVLSIPRNPDKTQEIPDAKQFEYKYDEQTRTYSEPRSPNNNENIVLSAQSGEGGEQGGDGEKTSCGVPSIGWILCGVSRFMADAMDKAYEWISEFLVVKPLTTDTDSGLYQAWDIARGLANAAFIVAFLIIVYSQITSVGINNYEIKKMIPRLIIAAVLVNVSYYICTIAVDVSNIMGDSIQRALMEVRESLPAPKAQTTWANMTAAVLSGFTMATIAGIGVASSGGVLALVPLLVPVLIGGVLSIFVALLVLAARQALITVLIVLSPIAFVAYLLPNTEKQFERWRGLFMNMLMIFPLFSLLFGGAQLASHLIIQNTDQISVVILAMAVQVAPLAITPFLLKVSHNLLTQLGGMANNRQKGLVDRSRNWAKERSELARERQNARGAAKPWFTPSGLSYRRARGKLHRQNELKRSQDRVAAAVANERRTQEVMADIKAAELQKNAGEAMSDRLFEERKATSAVLQRDSGNLHLAKLQTKQLEEADEARWQEALSNKVRPGMNHRYAAYAVDGQSALHELHVAEGNKDAAEKMQKKEYVQALQSSPALQTRVGGIDPNGATAAYAKAKAADVASKAELIKQIEDATSIMPGRIYQMELALRQAVNSGNAEAARAYINMLARSNDPGVKLLRKTVSELEGTMESNGIIEDVKFHIDNHASLNSDAEDMVKWSRTKGKTLEEVGTATGTWDNQTAQKIIGQKMSSQLIALKNGGVTEATMLEIMRNPAKVGLKPAVIKEIRRRLKIDQEGSEDNMLTDAAFLASLAGRAMDPPDPRLADPDY
jgi:hypothetical protein